MRPLFKQLMLSGLFAGSVLAAAVSQAGSTDLADKPLANSTTAVLLPNIMLDLDNSGSMLWDYMPDYVRMKSGNDFEYYCRYYDGSIRAVCNNGDPPFAASAFNKIYYNPAVRYDWPVKEDGSRVADTTDAHRKAYASPWAGIPSDGYGKQRVEWTYGQQLDSPCGDQVNCPKQEPTATINLASIGSEKANYPDRVWCKYGDQDDCVKALKGKTYAYPDSTYYVAKVVRGAPYYYNVTVKWCNDSGKCVPVRDGTHTTVNYSDWERVDIVSGRTYPRAATRTDCKAAASCSFEEEITNFATWYTWYRTRSQMAKSAIGLAFKDVRGTPVPVNEDKTDANYFHARMGLMTIDNATIKLPIRPFGGQHKTDFYSSLYGLLPNSSTPLRTALNEVGRLYKFGKNEAIDEDPIQAACQRNFAILATDGYWNGSGTMYTDADKKKAGVLKDQDGDATKVTRPSYAPYAKDDEISLADVAYYYYNTDLRPDMENIVPSAGGLPNIGDVATHQHMTTFTLGLGVDGTLAYRSDYKTAKSGDYYNILQKTENWPAPLPNRPESIDDLWHAAVSGRGTYFSAKDPAALQESLHQALGSIGQSDGSGAAAATSNLEPTPGKNFIYIANYRTGAWDGELSAFAIDVLTGEITGDAKWQAAVMLRNKVTSDGGDTRTIWTSDANNKLVPFTVTGLTGIQKVDFFNETVQQLLSQSRNWSTEQKKGANAATLVSFLRGQDPQVTVDKESKRLYRERDKVLGDFVHSQPVFVEEPPFGFKDTGYAEFVLKHQDRAGTVYAAANDGMLHAFDGTTGEERWAYIPPIVLPDLWQLAHSDYADRHRYFLDGPLTVADVQLGSEWRTILIGALGKGGRGYYALDITEPTKPQVLWNYTAEDNPNLGYSYGPAHVTKVDGKWVAVLTSGYNNVAEGGKYDGDGKGHLFVLDLNDPKMKDNVVDIATSAGTKVEPSGLARLNFATVENFYTDNSAPIGYGGDLLGNMWRFDLKAKSAIKLLELGSSKPIMAAPELTRHSEEAVRVFFGTGRFLGTTDLVLPKENEKVPVQLVVAFKDELDKKNLLDLQKTFVKHGMDTSGTSRTSANATAFDWDKNLGWYIELPSVGERVAVDPQIFDRTLLVPTVVPAASDCQPGGYSWLYQFNENGAAANANGTLGTRLNSPVVGMTVSRLGSGKPVLFAITADGKRPKAIGLSIPPKGGGGGGGDSGNNGTGGEVETKRLQWRELGK